jgi:hypothetical protein
MRYDSLRQLLSGASSDVREANPGLIKVAPKVTAIPDDSPLAAEFKRNWRALGGPDLAEEHEFDGKRRWRFDFCHLAAKVAIEIDGGVWSGGRHVRGQGYINDCSKCNAAMARGWRVFHLATGMMGPQHLEPIIALLQEGKL